MITWEEFANIVERYFKYLEADYGFKRLSKDKPFIKYKSNTISLDIYFDIDRHRELDLGIKPLKKIDKLERSFGIGVLIMLNSTNGKDLGYMSPFLNTKQEAVFEVKKLADLLLKYGLNVLKGDMSDLERIQKNRENPENYPPYKSGKPKFRLY
jgi:hypothetical protein